MSRNGLAVGPAAQIGQVVGICAGEGRRLVGQPFALNPTQGIQRVRLGLRARQQLAPAARQIHRHCVDSVGIDAGRQRRGKHTSAGPAVDPPCPLVGVSVRGNPHLAPAPARAAAGGQPDLQISTRQVDRGLEDDRRRGIAGLDVIVALPAHRALHPARRGEGGTDHDLLEGEAEIAVAILLLADHPHQLGIELQRRIGDCADVHGLEQAVLPAERGHVLVAGRQLALADDRRHLGANLRRGDGMGLDRVCRQFAVGLDGGRVLPVGRHGVVLVGPVEDLDGERVLGVRRAAPLEFQRRGVTPLLDQEIIDGQVEDRREIRGEGDAVARHHLIAIGQQLEHAGRPHERAAGDHLDLGQELLGRTLIGDRRRQKQAVGNAPCSVAGEVAKQVLRPAHAVIRVGEDVGHHRRRLGVNDPASGVMTQPAHDLEGVVGQ